MPIYEYCCDSHGRFEAFAGLEVRNLPRPCPDCGAGSRRAISAPRLAVLSPVRRNAAERNERSRHEPRVTGTHPSSSSMHDGASAAGVSGRGGGGGAGGCGCSGRRAAKRDSDAGRRVRTSYRGARPWVIEHR